ncbi:hypothetical protein PR048_008826 [Dryococelus australis]|uniref:Uncharacterized protein n=1 Tax=Dryococelus australis TaxID=614101 RepID=A0ABQ9HYK5_9NEOP|nr:hypothetical protein PR048_008826 [Dryococelus australis]
MKDEQRLNTHFRHMAYPITVVIRHFSQKIRDSKNLVVFSILLIGVVGFSTNRTCVTKRHSFGLRAQVASSLQRLPPMVLPSGGESPKPLTASQLSGMAECCCTWKDISYVDTRYRYGRSSSAFLRSPTHVKIPVNEDRPQQGNITVLHAKQDFREHLEVVQRPSMDIEGHYQQLKTSCVSVVDITALRPYSENYLALVSRPEELLHPTEMGPLACTNCRLYCMHEANTPLKWERHMGYRAGNGDVTFAHIPTLQLTSLTVDEQLSCSPPTKAKRVQSPTGYLSDFRKWEAFRTMSLVGRFSRGSPRFPHPFIPALLHTHLNHPYRLSRPHCYGAQIFSLVHSRETLKWSKPFLGWGKGSISRKPTERKGETELQQLIPAKYWYTFSQSAPWNPLAIRQPTDREPVAACSSQSGTKFILRASCNQSEKGCSHIKVTATSSRLGGELRERSLLFSYPGGSFAMREVLHSLNFHGGELEIASLRLCRHSDVLTGALRRTSPPPPLLHPSFPVSLARGAVTSRRRRRRAGVRPSTTDDAERAVHDDQCKHSRNGGRRTMVKWVGGGGVTPADHFPEFPHCENPTLSPPLH